MWMRVCYFVLGIIALTLGVLQYAYLRDYAPVFLNNSGTLIWPSAFDTSLLGVLERFSGNLPSFMHVLAFSLIHASVSSCTRLTTLPFLWFLIALVMEMAQGMSASYQWNLPYISGTYDPDDIMASSIASLVAVAIIFSTAHLAGLNRNTGRTWGTDITPPLSAI